MSGTLSGHISGWPKCSTPEPGRIRPTTSATACPCRLLEIVDAILRLTGRPDLAPVIEDWADNEIPDQWLDASKAREELDWLPKFALSEGLGETITWYQEYLAS